MNDLAQLQEKRETIHVWLIENFKLFSSKDTMHLVDPDEYFENLQEQVRLDKQIKSLKETFYN